MLKPVLLSLSLAAAAIAAAQGGSFGAQHPFSAPDAFVHHAPERMYDLQNLVLDFDVDYPNREFFGIATNTVAALKDGATAYRFNAGADTKIDDVQLNGKTAPYKRDEEGILVQVPATRAGQKDVVRVRYHLKESEITHGAGGGWHWHEPKVNDPSKVGFFLNGETADTRDWAVTWDYPNDFTTTETHTTVPADWQVMGNGVQVSDTPVEGGKRHTVVWRMAQPHATYLTTLVAGPFDIKTDNWRGVKLYYVVPKGKGGLLDYTFAHTKDMLSFFSDTIGVKYPWPKYAQDCTYDFGGGEENVSATTLGQDFLTSPRDSYYGMDSLNSHEMGHQWFGDYVTCKEWGEIWLNESFATFMEMAYMTHSLGINDYYREIEQNSRGYFAEAKRYRRPMVTNFYSNEGVLFDQHTYPKGGVLLTTLKRELGDALFYKGLNNYLKEHGDSPVGTEDFQQSMSEATGINLKPWFDQWIYKPGHPVIEWNWTWDDAKKAVVVHVKETQDTSNGTPIYDVNSHVALLRQQPTSPGTNIEMQPIHLDHAEQTFELRSASKPDAVVFDPEQEFLREINSQPWSGDELLVVAQYAPNCVDRQMALNLLLNKPVTDSQLNIITAMVREDKGISPVFADLSKLAALKKPELITLWMGQLNASNFRRRQQAVLAMADLPLSGGQIATIRSLVNDEQPYIVVAAAINALAKLDYANAQALIEHQAQTSTNGQVRGASLKALISNNAPSGKDLVFAALEPNQPDQIQNAGMEALTQVKEDDPRMIPAVKNALKNGNFGVRFAAINVVRTHKIKEALPELEELKKNNPRIAQMIDPLIKELSGH